MKIYNFKHECGYNGYTHIIVKRMRHNNDVICDLVKEDSEGNELERYSDAVFNRMDSDSLPVSLHQSKICCMCGDNPCNDWTVEVIKEWLRVEGIEYNDSMIKSELLQLCNSDNSM